MMIISSVGIRKSSEAVIFYNSLPKLCFYISEDIDFYRSRLMLITDWIFGFKCSITLGQIDDGGATIPEQLREGSEIYKKFVKFAKPEKEGLKNMLVDIIDYSKTI